MRGDKADATRLPSHRKVSLTAGLLYLLTFVSIPSVWLYNSVKSANYILGSGADTPAVAGGLLEIIVALAGIGTAVVLFPVLKKENESSALGLVAARILESGTIFVGVAFLLSIVTLRKAGVGSDALATSHALVALYDRIFLLGQSFMPAICDLLLGFLLYKSRLVPRGLSIIGTVGGRILLVGYIAVMFGLIGQHASITGLIRTSCCSIWVLARRLACGQGLRSSGCVCTREPSKGRLSSPVHRQDIVRAALGRTRGDSAWRSRRQPTSERSLAWFCRTPQIPWTSTPLICRKVPTGCR